MISFVLGTGNSDFLSHLINKFKKSNKNNIIIIVPEQYSFSAEQYVQSKLNILNKHIEVYSFKRLTHHIFKEFGGLAGEYASKISKISILNLILYEFKDKFKIYGKLIYKPRFAEILLDTIEQIKNSGISITELNLKLQTLTDKNLKLKTDEFLQIFTAYNSYIQSYYRDSSDDITRAIKIANENNFFHGKEIYFDKFLSFSGTQFQFINTMISQTDVSFCLYYEDKEPLFETTRLVINKIKYMAKQKNIKFQNFVVDNNMSKSPEIYAVEKNILRTKPTSLNHEFESTKNIKIIIAKNKYEEINYVLSQIIHLVQKGIKYSNIVLLTRSLNKYKNILVSALKNYNIPYFIDETSSSENMRLINFCHNLLSLTDNFNIETCLSLLHLDLTLFTTEEISIFENYIYTWNIDSKTIKNEFQNNPRGFVSKKNVDECDETNLQIAEKIRKAIIKSINIIKNSSDSSKEIATNILKALETLGVKDYIEANESSNHDIINNLTIQWNILIDILETIYKITKDISISKKLYKLLFQSAVKNIDAGQIPKTLNSLLIGSIERTIVDNPQATFIIGANDGEFPYHSSSNGIFTNNDLIKFEKINVKIGNTTLEKDSLERLIAYRTICSPSKLLYISTKTSDISESNLYPSEIVSDLIKTFGEQIVHHVSNKDIIFQCLTNKSTLFQLAYHFNDNSKESESLKEYLNNNKNYHQQITLMNTSQNKKQQKKLPNNFFPKIISPSQIEQFYRCPFSYYCKYGLNIKPRSQTNLDSPNVGLIVHYILEKVVSIPSFLDMSTNEIKINIEKQLLQYIKNNLGGEKNKSAKFIQTCNNLIKILLELCENIKNELNLSKYKPIKFEYEISNSSKTKCLKVPINYDSSIYISGKIDRIDMCTINNKKYIRIIDYKTGNKSINFTDLQRGLNLQMLIYLFAIYQNGEEEFGDFVPAGILYMPATGAMKNYTISERNPSEEKVKETIKKGFRKNGLILDSPENIEAMEKIEDGNQGQYIPLRMSKDGKIFKSDAEKFLISKFELDSLFVFVKNQIKKMYRSLLDGVIEQSPINIAENQITSCDYCDYKEICNLENIKTAPLIKKITKSEFFDMLSEEIRKKLC